MNKAVTVAFSFVLGVSISTLAQAPPTPTAPPTKAPATDNEILTAQINYYLLVVPRLQADIADLNAKLTKRESEWAEYSKSLWEIPGATSSVK